MEIHYTLIQRKLVSKTVKGHFRRRVVADEARIYEFHAFCLLDLEQINFEKKINK